MTLGLAASQLGSYYIQNYTPEEYGAFPQNWAITQDPHGIIYVGNGMGILESLDGYTCDDDVTMLILKRI